MTDQRVVFAVVLALAAIGLVGIVGALVLAGMGKTVPGEVIAMASGAGGALASILARTSARKEDAP
jgi:hypothetical protein